MQLLDAVHRAGKPLGELADAAMTRLPQVLHNVRVADKGIDLAASLAAEIAAVEAELGDHGRVLVRGSGTEPLVRVMVEAPTAEAAETAAARLVAAVRGSRGHLSSPVGFGGCAASSPSCEAPAPGSIVTPLTSSTR